LLPQAANKVGHIIAILFALNLATKANLARRLAIAAQPRVI
jgi:hypothetical protein